MSNGDFDQVRFRLEHALQRLQSEPRAIERRDGDRRRTGTEPWTGVERRSGVDRRQTERRG